MSKAVLTSVHPKWCLLMANRKKLFELRKTKPNIPTPFKCYIYCTNTKPFLVWGDVFRGSWGTEFTSISGYSREKAEEIWEVYNGKVMGEFVCDEIKDCRDVVMDDTCFSVKDWLGYTKGHKGAVYGWHISDLVIYEQPKELSEFNHCGRNYHFNPPITKAPQSWCYVEELK